MISIQRKDYLTFIVLLPCRLLTSFISTLTNLIPKFFFLMFLNAPLLRCSLNQHYHLSDSFVNDLNKSLTHVYSMYGRCIFKFLKIILCPRKLKRWKDFFFPDKNIGSGLGEHSLTPYHFLSDSESQGQTLLAVQW